MAVTVYKAGGEVDSYCTRCKMDLLHKIVAVAGGKPARVECRTCMGVHNYRMAQTDRAAVTASASKAPSAKVAAASTTHRVTGAKTAPVKHEPPPPSAPPPGVAVRSYRVTETFFPNTWLQHKTFGFGQVVRDAGPNKIEVRFNDAIRMLAHGVTP